MIRLEHHHPVTSADVVRIRELAAHSSDRGLSDDYWLELASGSGHGFLAFEGHALVGYGHMSLTDGTTTVQILTTDPFTVAVEAAVLEHVAAPGRWNWWVLDPTDQENALAASAGLEVSRQVIQMRCQLPAHPALAAPTRAYRPGIDDREWLAVNARAFASHPEQGAWTINMLTARFAEPWFRADGFLVHEVDGAMAGFCWTKIHSQLATPLGEIYVIAVDPPFHGRGLGRALTEAGLAWLESQGITEGMLYVDATNSAAVALYRSMGFEAAHINTLFS